MFGDDVWNQNAQAEAVQLAELLGAPVFGSRQTKRELPDAPSVVLWRLSGGKGIFRSNRAATRSSVHGRLSWPSRICGGTDRDADWSPPQR